jgi:hypothetical protein
MAPHRNVVRIQETDDELRRLREAFGAWLERRRDADTFEQYATQLDTLERTLLPLFAQVAADVEAARTLTSTGALYERCRENERRIVFLEHYWSYFRAKWDQRDGGQGDVLRAADEVVWSCYAGAFAEAEEDPAAAPLPYLEPYFTPRAIPRVDPPPDLKASDALLQPALRVLPLPTVGLPPVTFARPWWLIFLAHETGHHVQHDLAGRTLRTAFGALLEGAAGRAPGSSPSLWRGWNEELFADAFSVLSTGPAAAWAMGELLETTGEGMLTSRDPRYPPPIVREAVMAGVLEAAGLAHGSGVPAYAAPAVEDVEIDGDGDAPRAAAHAALSALEPVAAAIVIEPIAGEEPLPALCAWRATRFGLDGDVAWWRDQFLGEADPVPPAGPDVRSARLAVAGAVAAWQELAADVDESRLGERTEELARRVRTVLPDCRPGGRRAARAEVAPDVTEAREALASALFGAELQAEA